MEIPNNSIHVRPQIDGVPKVSIALPKQGCNTWLDTKRPNFAELPFPPGHAFPHLWQKIVKPCGIFHQRIAVIGERQ
jgi:hypothetical protein